MSNIRSILLIDDDQDDIFFFSKALESVDPEVELHTAHDGADALEKLRFFRPDLIMVDMVMPVMGGASFLRAINERSDLRAIPTIVYTTTLSIFDRNEVLKLGADDVILKPELLEATVSVIRSILSQDRQISA